MLQGASRRYVQSSSETMGIQFFGPYRVSSRCYVQSGSQFIELQHLYHVTECLEGQDVQSGSEVMGLVFLDQGASRCYVQSGSEVMGLVFFRSCYRVS